MVWSRWSWNSLRRQTELPEAIDIINERMNELERKLEESDRVLDFGPVPGAYFPIVLAYSNAAGVPEEVVALSPTPFEARPIAAGFTVFGAGATVTVQINNGSLGGILAAGQSVSTGSPVTLNKRGDFAVDKIYAPDVSLEVLSVDAGTPIHVFATLILKNVQKVEPA